MADLMNPTVPIPDSHLVEAFISWFFQQLILIPRTLNNAGTPGPSQCYVHH